MTLGHGVTRAAIRRVGAGVDLEKTVRNESMEWRAVDGAFKSRSGARTLAFRSALGCAPWDRSRGRDSSLLVRLPRCARRSPPCVLARAGRASPDVVAGHCT